nr:transposase [Pararoseomonas baculiformis]
MDATYAKGREAGRIVPTTVTVVVGVDADIRRKVLRMAVAKSSGAITLEQSDERTTQRCRYMPQKRSAPSTILPLSGPLL